MGLVEEGPNQRTSVLQLLRGSEDRELQELHLERNPAMYNFTRQGAGLNMGVHNVRARGMGLSQARGVDSD